MIPRTIPTWQARRWQDDMTDLVRQPEELFRMLELDPAEMGDMLISSHQFPLRVPRPFVKKMNKGDINDPLLRQVLPVPEEFNNSPLSSRDPLRESDSTSCPGLLHKYQGRVLLILTGSCAIHCRYCFRRHFPYQSHKSTRKQWEPALNYISNDPSITEVIYSGGDPLSAPDKLLAWLTGQISQIPHVKRVRIHSRLPIVLPHRIDEPCLSWMSASRLQKVVVLHSNHPNEIDRETGAMVTRLKSADVTVLNQTVLLKGVNDDADTLAALSETLFDAGVLPYYLHLLDRVEGAEHFAIPEWRARVLYRQLLARLPGFLLPKMVKELPYLASKLPIL